MIDSIALACPLGLPLVLSTVLMLIDFVVFAGLALLSFTISTVLIGWGIPRLTAEEGTVPVVRYVIPVTGIARRADAGPARKAVFDWRSTGLWIGLCEVALVFPLVCHQEFGALAIIFGAKEIVRRDKIRENPSHYLLGTLVNLSVAVLFALLAKRIVQPNA